MYVHACKCTYLCMHTYSSTLFATSVPTLTWSSLPTIDSKVTMNFKSQRKVQIMSIWANNMCMYTYIYEYEYANASDKSLAASKTSHHPYWRAAACKQQTSCNPPPTVLLLLTQLLTNVYL